MSGWNRLTFYVRYSLRSLRREGMRTILAGLSIAFGVLSLVSMQSLSGALLHGSLFDEHLQYGGDAQINAPHPGDPLTEAELAQIETWQQEGLISRSTPLAQGTADYLRTPNSGRVTFLRAAYGFDPATYPLIGGFTLREPADAPPADVLRDPNTTLITRDLADSLGLHLGDTITLSGGDTAPASLTITGIIDATPNQQGKSIFYSLETARLIENRPDVITSVSALWGSMPDAAETVVNSDLWVLVAGDRDASIANTGGAAVFDMMLKGAGVLGLLVGGLGVSNTLQVVMARRKLEIAMLKTLGYRRYHLFILIGLETSLLGIIGGVIGAVAGAALGGRLLDLLSGTGSFMLRWSPDPPAFYGSILAGASTAIVFGLQSILASSATRPVELLRGFQVKSSLGVLAGRGALFGILILIFGVLVGLTLGSIPEGILYVLVGGLLLLVLRGIFWGVLWVMLTLPLPLAPMLRLARAGLRQRKTQSSLIIMALFAGAFAVTFAAVVIYNAQTVVSAQRPSDAGYNLLVYTSPAHADAVREQMQQQTIDTIYTRYLVQGTANDTPIAIEGRSLPDLSADMVSDAAWDGSVKTVLLPESESGQYRVGDPLTLKVNDAVQDVRVAGFYRPSGDTNTHITGVANGIIVAPETAVHLGGERTQVEVVASVPVGSLDALTDSLGETLPDALVFSKADVNNLLIGSYRTLFTFAVSVAGLAFVAGAILIANAAALTIVERRREIGIFKATGYTSARVLRLLLSEYGILGFLGGVWGIIGVITAAVIINRLQPRAGLTLEPAILGGMLLVSVVIAVGSAALIAWHPAHIRPQEVLRYE